MKPVITSGKRKRAIARAVTRAGTGKVRLNKVLLSAVEPELARLRIEEPLMLAGEKMGKVDIEVTVSGGGVVNAADAARLAIAKGLVAVLKDKKLEAAFMEYDRHMLVADVRRREKRKPNAHGKARAKRQKSYR